MSRTRYIVCGLLGALVISLGASQAQGTLIGPAWRGLVIAGFDTQLQRDLFQDGWNFTFAQNFINKEYDFGNTELTISGPIVGGINFGRRGIPEVEIFLQTPASSGLTYSLVSDTGLGHVDIENATFNIDQRLKINALGFYTLELSMEGEGEITSTGPRGDQDNLSFEVGPINLRGHILVDLINAILGTNIPGGAPELLLSDFLVNSDLQVQAQVDDQVPAAAIVVPEPASLCMLVVGIAGLVWMPGRKRPDV